MLTSYDYLNIAFYFGFIISVGIVFAHRSKNTSDYFRGGGALPWWLTGASSWMASFSAWTFTGAAGKIYETGPYVLCLYFSSLPALVMVFLFTCYRFRRMRVVTSAEAIRLRFGAVSQQFYTWVRLPFLLLFGGVGLNSIGVFMAGVFQTDLNLILILLGITVTFVALLGGSMSVVASDFVQMFLVVTVALVVDVLVLWQPSIGGFSGLIRQAPAIDFHWDELARPEFILFWSLALTINNLFSQNSMDLASKYLMAASDQDARRMVLIPLVGTMVGPLIWIIPPMAASILHPDLSQLFPTLTHPHEAAFLASARDVLPQGMMGLLMCGIFAATLTNMDASMNQGVGIFVRNFYLPILNPQCSEKKLLLVSKASTALFGTIVVGIALVVNHFRTLPLFELVNQLGISLLLPLTVPLCLGLYFKRTPSWSTWSTVVIGLIISFFIKFMTTPVSLKWLPGCLAPYNGEETNIYYIAATVSCVMSACVGWFFFTSLFYHLESEEYRATVDEFFSRLKRPLENDSKEAGAPKENTDVASAIGKLCLAFGSFILLMMLIPNPWSGRLCYLFCGGVMVVSGFFLNLIYRNRGKDAGKP